MTTTPAPATMFVPLALLAAVPISVAQSPQNSDYITGLAQTLQRAGLHQFAGAVADANNTATGANLLAQLPNGLFTVFAPNDQAFSALPSNISNNPELLADTLSYHVVSGNFSGQTTTAPTNTLGRTFLTASSFVELEGNKAQVLAWNTRHGGKTRILNQNTGVTIIDTATYSNLFINIINAVIGIPGSLSAVLDQNSLSSLSSIFTQTSVFSSTNSNTNISFMDSLGTGNGVRGYTLFAPDNAALSKVSGSLGQFTGNQGALVVVLHNHIINGTSVYSPSLSSSSRPYLSAAGEPLGFVTNSSGTYIISGNGVASAKITKTDLLVNNGVVHVIDGVLANLASNPAAASFAYQSATAAAAQSTTETGPIGLPTSPVGPFRNDATSRRPSDSVVLGALVELIGMVVGAMLV